MSIDPTDRHAILTRLMRYGWDDPVRELTVAARNLYHAYRHRHLLIHDHAAGWVECGCRPATIFPGIYVDGSKVPFGDARTTPRIGWWAPSL
jgi:hypothetical protein